MNRGIYIEGSCSRLAKRREILIFPRTVGNTGNSQEILVIPGNYWEIGYSLTKTFINIFINSQTAIFASQK